MALMSSQTTTATSVDGKMAKDEVIRSADALATIRAKFEPRSKVPLSKELDAFTHALHAIREELNSLRLDIKTLEASVSGIHAGTRALESHHPFTNVATDKASPRRPSRLRQTANIARHVSALLDGATLSGDE